MGKIVDSKNSSKPYVVIPNWNGADELRACLDSLQEQTLPPHIVVVDNGSTDDSVTLIGTDYPEVELILHTANRGYAGGVNPGLQLAIDRGVKYAAVFNNDAVAGPNWLKELAAALDAQPVVGVATCKLYAADGTHLDSTGDYYTTWGLPYPRGRGELDKKQYDDKNTIFAASGGASLYRVAMFKEVGLFDEDFFAYYEDVDLSFRAQLAGWKVQYVPSAHVYHATSTTSSKLKGFTTYQTMKNLQLLWYKNVPRRYLWHTGVRFTLAHGLFFMRAVSRGQGWHALRGDIRGTWLVFTARGKRRHIQRSKKVSDEYIWSILVHDLPPNAHALRKLRQSWRKLRGRV